MTLEALERHQIHSIDTMTTCMKTSASLSINEAAEPLHISSNELQRLNGSRSFNLVL